MERLMWDEYFLTIAQAISLRASCPTLRVGSVFVNAETRAIVSTGYNGAPRGLEQCGEACSVRKPGSNTNVCRAIHAEVNGIINAAYNGASTRDSVLYLTHTPCPRCAPIIINAGVLAVYAIDLYGDWEPGGKLLLDAGIKMAVKNIEP